MTDKNRDTLIEIPSDEELSYIAEECPLLATAMILYESDILHSKWDMLRVAVLFLAERVRVLERNDHEAVVRLAEMKRTIKEQND